MQVFRFSCFHIYLIGILYNLYFGLSIPFLFSFEKIYLCMADIGKILL